MAREGGRNALRTITGYVLWAMLTGGMIFILISGRAALIGSLAEYASSGYAEGNKIGLIDKLYAFLGAIGILIACIVLERSFATAATWAALGNRSLKASGIELIALSFINMFIQLSAQVVFSSIIYTAQIVLPLLVGGIFLVLAMLLKRSGQKRTKPENGRDNHQLSHS